MEDDEMQVLQELTGTIFLYLEVLVLVVRHLTMVEDAPCEFPAHFVFLDQRSLQRSQIKLEQDRKRRISR